MNREMGGWMVGWISLRGDFELGLKELKKDMSRMSIPWLMSWGWGEA